MEKVPFKILVAVDFSDGASRALDEALFLAKRLDAVIELVHVSTLANPTPAELMTQTMDTHAIDQSRRQLSALRDRVSEEGVPAAARLRVGDVTYGLLETIEQLKPDLVVVGSHGKGAIARALMGSVSTALCRRSIAPVLVVPALRSPADDGRSAWSCPACGHMHALSESTDRCAGCGAAPVHWLTAPLEKGPADAIEPHVGEELRDELPQERTGSSQGLFATSPPGTEGYDVNPELRVRY